MERCLSFLERVPTAVQINLVLSLIFGLGQVVVGLVVAWRLMAGKAWRRPSMLLLLTVSCWFVASGITELFVSGMETAQTVSGALSEATFALWRARADDLLLAASVALVVGFAVWYAALRLRGAATRR